MSVNGAIGGASDRRSSGGVCPNDEKVEALLARVLLGTDGSPDAVLAARAASDLTGRSGAELHVVHAWDAEVRGAYMMTLPGARENWCEQQAGETLAEQIRLIEGDGGAVTGAHLRRGDATGVVCELAGELGADLVVLGSRGLGAVRRLILGSVSGGVVRDAACPVLVVRGGEDAWPPARVVVGEDLSEDSGTARFATALGDLYGVQTVLVHARPPLETAQKSRISGFARPNAELQKTERALTALATELGEASGRIPEARVVVGEAGDALLEAADGGAAPTLMAVGCRGLGTLRRLAGESVSNKVLNETRGPVLVHRDRPGEEGARGP